MMKKLITILILLFCVTILYPKDFYNHKHLNGKWYAYALHKEDGTYKRYTEGILFFEFFDKDKVKVHILDGDVLRILFSERQLIEGIYYTHIKIELTNESWLIQEGIPNKNFCTLQILKGNFPLEYKIDYRVLISKEENYFSRIQHK